MDTTLSFSYHIDTIVSKSLNFKDYSSLRILSSAIWSPHFSVLADKLESVQHKLLRYISFKINKPYVCIDSIMITLK